VGDSTEHEQVSILDWLRVKEIMAWFASAKDPVENDQQDPTLKNDSF
jgi:hypothetical protein